MKEIENFFGIKKEELIDFFVDTGTNIALAIVILIIGFGGVKLISRSVGKLLQRGEADKSIVSFLTSFISIALKTLVIITAITQLGVEMTSFVAILGAIGLSVGMAFSGTLSNFAGGIIILLFKPFKVGDYVKMQGEEGHVDEILTINTVLKTTDNKVVILANGAVANGTIINYTKADKRRVDWSFGIAYGDDLQTAKELLKKFTEEDTRILKEPETFIGLGELADSSVNITLRAWVKTDDYWEVFFAMNERVYMEFESAGLTIPFPQMDVHMIKQDS